MTTKERAQKTGPILLKILAEYKGDRVEEHAAHSLMNELPRIYH